MKLLDIHLLSSYLNVWCWGLQSNTLSWGGGSGKYYSKYYTTPLSHSQTSGCSKMGEVAIESSFNGILKTFYNLTQEEGGGGRFCPPPMFSGDIKKLAA